MPKIDNADAPRFDIPGVTFTNVAAPSRGSGENAVWRALVTPGEGALHHVTREEIIVALTGIGKVRMDGETFVLNPGDAFAVPAFADFQLGSVGPAPFEAMVVLPAGGRAVVPGKPAFQPPWSV